ncbi:1,6-anhydro-N-acetylmuramyl-L-alanine amidase AmpD [Alteromonas oceanisediminis]|uniref:1,6-anhydro-N-acetylmuramyl-L-alanine amidase AmpD n=1 Tax=Alteromonas oceanisediminis TaxID=2836180 RepID=UPI001BDA43D8|nr:1,6-anhydro-N-acetylmuramyl-L-alanine amidase AmpD [Alteromonas oceanisediminis]MBT0585545.1 1,6-anhydro-N-acetylmuramyl-L-alanine amidase AmpD [Alteromonas oceanisediminis]
MKIEQGWVSGAVRKPSPFADERASSTEPNLLVVHNISLPPGEFGGDDVERLFLGTLDAKKHPFFAEIAHLTVSAHLFIRRDGELIQFVPLTRRAWHAGVSSFQGQVKCNDFSIGIELEGTDVTPYTDTQYEVLTAVTQAIQAAYPAISLGRIVGHNDIAPGRKTDPGASFDWARFRQTIMRTVGQ